MDSNLRTIDDHVGSINVVKFTFDGNYCITGSDDRTLKLWNPHKRDPSKSETTSLLIKSYEGAHGYSVLDVSIAKDKTRFASCGEDKTCFIWDVASGQTLRRVQAHSHKINAVEFNDEATVLMTASYDQTVKCWDMRAANRDPIQTMSDFKDSVTSLARTDSTIIAGSVDGHVRSYDLRKGQLQSDSMGFPVTSVRVSNDQNCYLAACLDSTVRLVEVATGKILKEYKGHKHTSFKTEAVFQADCNHVMCGSEDGTAVRWNMVTGAVVARVECAHFKAVSSISYHPTKSIFITASYDGTAKVWETAVV